MQGQSSRRETEQQRTRRIFILGIVLNQLSICARLSNFLFADVPLDYTPESVATEFKFAGGKLPVRLLAETYTDSNSSAVVFKFGVRLDK